MITDGYADGLGAVVWAAGALLGVGTVLGPMVLGGWLLTRSARILYRSGPVWWLRGQWAVRRLPRARG